MNALPSITPTVLRHVQMEGYCFHKTEAGLRISYVWGNGAGRNVMDLVPVGNKRVALVNCGEWRGTFETRSLLAALADYRRRARWAREDAYRAELDL